MITRSTTSGAVAGSAMSVKAAPFVLSGPHTGISLLEMTLPSPRAESADPSRWSSQVGRYAVDLF
jgi:hypothetical protein